MWDEFMEYLPRLTYREYLDQAVHNKLLHLGDRNYEMKLTDNLGGVLAHLATSNLAEFSEDWSKGLLTKDGRLVSIVHQYDRHPDLVRVLLGRLAANSEGAMPARAPRDS
jgi:hypothetical protein